jgi:hypothetical protein
LTVDGDVEDGGARAALDHRATGTAPRAGASGGTSRRVTVAGGSAPRAGTSGKTGGAGP